MASGRHSAKARAKALKEQERKSVRDLASGKLGGSDFEYEYLVDKPSKRVGNKSQGRAGGIRYYQDEDEPSARTRAFRERSNWDYSSQPSVASRRKIRLRKLRSLSIGLVALIIVVFLAGLVVHDQIDPATNRRDAIIVVVPPGATGSSVANILSSKGVIKHPLFLRLYMRVYPVSKIEPGPFKFYKNEHFSAIEATINKGPNQTLLDYRLTVPEGLTLGEIAQLVGKLPGHTAQGFIRAVSSGQVTSTFKPANGNMEGLLFPDTYFISRNETDLEIAQQMSDRLIQIASQLNLTTQASQLGLSPLQVITVASIIQREAITASDMGKVAQVIYNRLKENMKLQIDSTVIYGLASMGQTVTSEITISQEQTPSPYNTYLHFGLPPGPIAAPGAQALQAALHPTPGPWLYYVTIDKQGDEAFSTTLAQQNANIALAKRNGA